METDRRGLRERPYGRLVGTELNAERQWRLPATNVAGFAMGSVGTELNAERQWRLPPNMGAISSSPSG